MEEAKPIKLQEKEKKLEEILIKVIETKKRFQKEISELIEIINKELKTIYSSKNYPKEDKRFMENVKETEEVNEFIKKKEEEYDNIKHINSQKEFEKIIDNL